MTALSIWLPCAPPRTTAQQQKRVTVINGRPHFYRGGRMNAEASMWALYLAPHAPAAPLAGPLELRITLVYPHLADTAKRDRHRRLPKMTRPDIGNTVKHLEDTIVHMRFMVDDNQVVRLTAEKWHGPADQVGIGIELRCVEAP